jgi:hypothetical protein
MKVPLKGLFTKAIQSQLRHPNKSEYERGVTQCKRVLKLAMQLGFGKHLCLVQLAVPLQEHDDVLLDDCAVVLLSDDRLRVVLPGLEPAKVCRIWQSLNLNCLVFIESSWHNPRRHSRRVRRRRHCQLTPFLKRFCSQYLRCSIFGPG